MVSWREQPTRYDIEALQANIRRVGLVIRLRWALLVVLVLYSGIAGMAYASRIGVRTLTLRMAIPAVALGLVVLYNAFYQLNYKRLGNIAIWNQGQLLLDSLVVTVLIYFSGGVNSWFWSMYSLFILEAAFILPKRRDAWLLTAACVFLLGSMEWLEFLRVVPHISMPFAAEGLHLDTTFVAVRFGWQVAVLAGTAAVSSQLVGSIRTPVAGRRAEVIDEVTGLYSRQYFTRALSAEVARAERDSRPIHVLLIDIDHFGDFNRNFGIETGDRLLVEIASSIAAAVDEAGDTLVTSNLVARFGGEEFVALLAEETDLPGAPQHHDARRLAERVRAAVAATRVDEAGVTVSVGVASYPNDGASADGLLDSADAALWQAIEAGGDRVCDTHCKEEEDADLIELPDGGHFRDPTEL